MKKMNEAAFLYFWFTQALVIVSLREKPE